MDDNIINELERRRLQKQMFALEDEKEAVEARYRYLLQQARVGLFTLTARDCRLLDANSEMVQLFLCDTLEDLKLHLQPNPEDDFYFIDPRHFANIQEGEAVSFSLHTFRKNGDSFWARVILQSLEHTEILEGIITDISEQVKADIDLRKAIVRAEQAQQEAEEANKAKSRFLANISHEIRTPLNGIIGFTEIVMASLESPEALMYAGKILDETENLMTLINQLLDLSKIEANRLQLNFSSFPLRSLLSETISFIRLRARNKGLKLTVDYDSRIPEFIWSDSYRLRQVLLNLLSNAVKFTSQGGIKLSAVVERDDPEGLILRFEVKDSGIGIPEHMHMNIFESFVQADTSISRNYGGTGLGISISRELVNIMGGKIWFESKEGEGSVFYFTIHCRKAAPGELVDRSPLSGSAELTADLQGLRILVVEDYPTNREIVQHHLFSAGCRVDLCSNGLNALKKVKEKSFDLILMDVHMPRMDGMEATSRIRSLENYKDVPILGMTANVLSSNKEACRRAGMNEVLNKPLRKKALLRAVSFWCLKDDGDKPPVTKPAVPGEPKDESCGTLPLDYRAFLKEMDGDRVVVRDIILGFLDALEVQQGEIEEAIYRRDTALIHREAHSIKGGALNLGAEDLASAALALERAASDKYSDIIPHLFAKLKGSIDEVLACRDRFASIV